MTAGQPPTLAQVLLALATFEPDLIRRHGDEAVIFLRHSVIFVNAERLDVYDRYAPPLLSNRTQSPTLGRTLSLLKLPFAFAAIAPIGVST